MKEEGMQETANKLIHIGKPIEMDDALLELYRPFRFQICPERAAAYFLAVQRETAAVRLILAGKQNGFDAENIRERLRDLYV